MGSGDVTYQGIVPYVFYDDAAAAMDWLARVFGFEEISRWNNEQGHVQNAEMRVGDTEIWIDGGGRLKFDEANESRPVWYGIWVDDVDAMYAKVKAAEVDVAPPVTREFGVQMLTVQDPEGYLWGFMRRVDEAG